METKTCGSDPVPSSVWKDLAPYIRKDITTIVNASLREGVFVNKWKIAIIKPLLKKIGLDFITKNYRPVTNLSFTSKLVKKCMLVWFNKHCEDNQLMPVYQSAYRSNHCCETSLIQAGQWHLLGLWKPKYGSIDSTGSQCCLQHSWPWGTFGHVSN